MTKTDLKFRCSFVVAPSGAIDHVTAPALEAKLKPLLEAASQGDALVIDLGDVNYMSSAGLRVLLGAKADAEEASVGLGVANRNDCLREIFEIAQYESLFAVFDSVKEAVASLGGSEGAGR